MGGEHILALYLAHRGDLLRYAGGIVGDRTQAEDVVQEAWMRFCTVAKERMLEEPVGYLYQIVRNLALDGQRKSRRERQVIQFGGEDGTGISDHAPTPEAAAQARDEIRLLAAAMAELPERTRIALEMRRLGGCKLKEIAVHLGISVTVAHDIIVDGVAHCRRRVRPSRGEA